MKRIRNAPVMTIRGAHLRIPERDVVGDIVFKDGSTVPSMVNSTVATLLLDLIFQIPGEWLTHQDTLHMDRLYNQLVGALKSDLEDTQIVIPIEEGEWEWVDKKLSDDRIGPRLFRANLQPLKHQLQNLAQENELPQTNNPALAL